jgi:Reeler domain
LASFHDSPNNVNSNTQQVTVKPANGNAITAGKANQLTFSTANGAQLKGLLAYARDSSNTPQGTFTDAGTVFTKFPGCGTTSNGQVNAVIQTTGVSATVSALTLPFGILI